MMNAWFGPPGGAPYEDDCPRVPVPVGQPCGRCGEVFAEGDAGVTVPRLCTGNWIPMGYHYACNLRAVIGGVNHLRSLCTCCGGTLPPDPPDMSIRQAAEAAVAEWEGGRMFDKVIREDSDEGRALLDAVERERNGDAP